ncbi:hypothetical protein NDU88_004911 [Pleurodeles waltl]|uniref:Uncharacterized protein n=1 Tax=Pleurodeles waltl TaxID=8319 RepID=A0AAV7WWG0_PLEWA|nr:hypothetical protein NDU88_004911 [Pleurodeles waltl]
MKRVTTAYCFRENRPETARTIDSDGFKQRGSSDKRLNQGKTCSTAPRVTSGEACRCRRVHTTRQHEQLSSLAQHPRGPHTSSNSAGSTAYLQACRGVGQIQGRHRPRAAIVLGPDPATSPPPAARACPNKQRQLCRMFFLLNGKSRFRPRVTTSPPGLSKAAQARRRPGQARPGPGAPQQPAPSTLLSPLPGRLPLLQGSSSRAAAPLRGRSDPRSPSMPCAAPHSVATPPRSPAQRARPTQPRPRPCVTLSQPLSPGRKRRSLGQCRSGHSPRFFGPLPPQIMPDKPGAELTQLASAMFSGSAMPPWG